MVNARDLQSTFRCDVGRKPDRLAVRNFSSMGDTGTHGQQIDGGLWVVPNDDRGAFPIGGSLPEHVTLTLLCIRMCSLLATELIYRGAACKDVEVRKTMMAAGSAQLLVR
jgi:hypothetical protein